jgi:large subunit ribosomal protein L30
MSKLLPSVSAKQIKVELVKSVIGTTEKQQASVRGLGLRKIGSTVTIPNTPENRGMVNAVIFLLKVEEA